MAISETHFSILRTLKERGILPQGGRILEIGEANFYGDFPAQEVFDLAGDSCDPNDSFAVAKLIYKAMFAPSEMWAIDMDPNRGDRTRPYDLNEPLCFVLNTSSAMNLMEGGNYSVVYNHGTAEHIFNVAQVFKTMHENCKAGGLLIHEGPFTGWVDHGFYCLQPTLFWDVAAANDYKIEFVAIEHLASKSWHEIESREQILAMKQRDQLADNLMLFVLMRKQLAQPFKIPQQGVYSGSVSAEATAAWKSLR